MKYLAEKILNYSFEGKTDKAGRPYTEHCYRVAESVAKTQPHDEQLVCIALLHDLLEDCPEWSAHALRCLFPDRVVDGILALTLKRNQAYNVYIEDVSRNEDARIVKLCDLKDNLDVTRLQSLTEKDLNRVRKYHAAHVTLCNLEKQKP